MIFPLSHSFSADPLCCKLADVNPEWFFSEDPEEIEQAQSVCSHCPIKRECLDWACSFEKNQKYLYGIFGGLTPEMRREILT